MYHQKPQAHVASVDHEHPHGELLQNLVCIAIRAWVRTFANPRCLSIDGFLEIKMFLKNPNLHYLSKSTATKGSPVNGARRLLRVDLPPPTLPNTAVQRAGLTEHPWECQDLATYLTLC